MRALAIAAVTVLAVMIAPAIAADMGVGMAGRYPTADQRYYPDCGWRGPPYHGNAYGPDDNSEFFGPLGYHCYRGVYAYFPDYASCYSVRIKGPHGWQRVRHCR